LLSGVRQGTSTLLFNVRLGAARACFTASALGCDGRQRFLVGGRDGEDFGGRAALLVFDSDGNLLSQVPLAEAPNGIAATHTEMFLTTSAGLLGCTSAAIAGNDAHSECTLITPVLRSPRGLAERPWLRAELSAALPAGTTAQISYAATSDEAMRDSALAIAADQRRSASQKFSALQTLLGNWSAPIVLVGSDASATWDETSVPMAAPLTDVADEYLWLRVILTAAPGAPLPSVAGLSAWYPERSLLDDLPAVYRQVAADPHSFLRALLGVLETTTQNLDARIASLGSRVHPDTALGAWIDYVAGWVGLPWDAALDVSQKHRLLQSAAALSRTRGTRAGLETLLQCLFSGPPRRFRIIDIGVDFGLVTVGGAGCTGSCLPAVLGGLPAWANVLTRKTVLGKARLCPTQPDDGRRRFTGKLRIEIAASSEERRNWEPWLRAVIAAAVPATTQFRVRWLSPGASYSDAVLTPESALRPPPSAHLGAGTVMGAARLPPRPGFSLQ
jgi:phage tail-like protein